MAKEKSTSISKIIFQIIGLLTLALYVTWMFGGIFFWDEIVILGDKLTSRFPILIYSSGALLFGAVSVLQYRDIDKKKKKGAYSICTMLIFLLGFIYCVVKLFSRFGGNL